MNVANRIKQRMKDLNLKSVNIVKMTGVSKGSVSQWVNDVSKPSGQNLIALSKALGCDPDWLLTGKEGKLTTPDSLPVNNDKEVEARIITEEQIKNGILTPDHNEYFEVKPLFSKSFLKSNGISHSHVLTMKVDTHSMEPTIPNESIIAFDTSKNDIADGKTYVINQDGMVRVRVIYLTPGGGIRLRSINVIEYPDELYKKEEIETIEIIGRVFWVSNLI